MKHKIYGLNKFDITPKQLFRLGDKKVNITADLLPCPQKPLYKLSIAERKESMMSWRRKAYRKVLASWPHLLQHKLIGTVRRPTGIQTIVSAKEIPLILKMKQISYIWIDKIQGVKPIKQKTWKRYFGVFARFVLRVEGCKDGLQEYEDRLLIVMATSCKDAERRLKKEFRDYGKPYLNLDGEIVKWKFEKVLNVFDTRCDVIDPNGTEVYSIYGRMNFGC